MKVGIITINSAHNYGCMLQAWGLQEYIEKQDIRAEIINYRLPVIDRLYQPINVNSKLAKVKEKKKLRCKLFLKFSEKGKRATLKFNRFENFIANELHTTRPFTNYEELKESGIGNEYDILVTGSDQVWNGSITGGLNKAYFLDFPTKPVKRISFASSIGKSELHSYELEYFERYLKNFDSLAVREQSAKEMLTAVTDKPIDVVVDPTLLLEVEDYEKLKKPSPYKQGYILVHVINSDKQVKPIARELSKLTGLPIVHNRPNKKYRDELGHYDDAGVEEFLGLIENASYIVTNSFHATVFAIIYRRKFVTIPHGKYPERMMHLLNTMHLSQYLITKKDELPDVEDWEIDYDKVHKRWARQRAESQKILNKELGLELS